MTVREEVPVVEGFDPLAPDFLADPYAVVAVATQPGGPWDGVPVFSAWVADPD